MSDLVSFGGLPSTLFAIPFPTESMLKGICRFILFSPGPSKNSLRFDFSTPKGNLFLGFGCVVGSTTSAHLMMQRFTRSFSISSSTQGLYSASTLLSNSAGVVSAPLYPFPRKVPGAFTSINSCTPTPRTQPNSFDRSLSVCVGRISSSQNSEQDCKCPGTKSSTLHIGAFLGVGSGSSWSNTSLLSSAIGRSRLGLCFFDLTSSGVSFSLSK